MLGSPTITLAINIPISDGVIDDGATHLPNHAVAFSPVQSDAPSDDAVWFAGVPAIAIRSFENDISVLPVVVLHPNSAHTSSSWYAVALPSLSISMYGVIADVAE